MGKLRKMKPVSTPQKVSYDQDINMSGRGADMFLQLKWRLESWRFIEKVHFAYQSPHRYISTQHCVGGKLYFAVAYRNPGLQKSRTTRWHAERLIRRCLERAS